VPAGTLAEGFASKCPCHSQRFTPSAMKLVDWSFIHADGILIRCFDWTEKFVQSSRGKLKVSACGLETKFESSL